MSIFGALRYFKVRLCFGAMPARAECVNSGRLSACELCASISSVRVLHELKIKLLCWSFGAASLRVIEEENKKVYVWSRSMICGLPYMLWFTVVLCIQYVAFFKSFSVFLNICVGNWYFSRRTRPPTWKLLNKKLDVLAYPFKYHINPTNNIINCYLYNTQIVLMVST